MVTQRATAAQKGGGNGSRSGDPATRAKVIDAAVHCILELGFYRASSNAIVRQAGVTWGVIQHYFGTREKLMLEVLQHGAEQFVTGISDAHVEGETAAERVEQLIDILGRHYGQPEYLAYLQVMLNLDHDPETSSVIRETMIGVSERSSEHIRRLLSETLGGPSPVEQVLFLVVKGFVLGEQLRVTTSYDRAASTRIDLARDRALLAEMLAPYLDQIA